MANIKIVALPAGNALAGDEVFEGTEDPGGTPVSKKYTATQIKTFVGIVLATPVATTSGTSIDFTGIPAGTKRIIIEFFGVSTNGSDAYLIQLGDSGGIETSGYLGSASFIAGTVGSSTITAGFSPAHSVGTATVLHGTLVITLEDSSDFTWVAFGVTGRSDQATTHVAGGSKSLSAELDRIRLTTSGGVNTFDAGEVNITYE